MVPLAPVRIWLDTLLRSDVRAYRWIPAKYPRVVQLHLRPLIFISMEKKPFVDSGRLFIATVILFVITAIVMFFL